MRILVEREPGIGVRRQPELEWGAGRGRRRRLGVEAEVGEDRDDHGALLDEGELAHRLSAAGALQGMAPVDAGEQQGPGAGGGSAMAGTVAGEPHVPVGGLEDLQDGAGGIGTGGHRGAQLVGLPAAGARGVRAVAAGRGESVVHSGESWGQVTLGDLRGELLERHWLVVLARSCREPSGRLCLHGCR